MNTAERRLLDTAAALELLGGLICIPGENPPGKELGKANYLAGYFTDSGLPVRLHGRRPEVGHNATHDTAAFVTRVERANLESTVERTLGKSVRCADATFGYCI